MKSFLSGYRIVHRNSLTNSFNHPPCSHLSTISFSETTRSKAHLYTSKRKTENAINIQSFSHSSVVLSFSLAALESSFLTRDTGHQSLPSQGIVEESFPQADLIFTSLPPRPSRFRLALLSSTELMASLPLLSSPSRTNDSRRRKTSFGDSRCFRTLGQRGSEKNTLFLALLLSLFPSLHITLKQHRTRMQAITVKSPGQVEVRHVPLPQLAPGQILVKVSVSSLCVDGQRSLIN